MATMVARGSSPLASSISVQETGSRNKRKFRSETPPADLNGLASALQTEHPGYEFFPEEKVPDNSSTGYHCDMCTAPAYVPSEREIEFEDFRDVDWNLLTEAQLEEILLSNLDMIFKSVVKSITSYGYTEEVAMNAVLKSGICCGRKDTVSNTLENVLAFLRNGQEVTSSLGDNFSKDLQELEKTVLRDMVSVIREVRPFFSTGDAMWCLLICDMNVTHACAMDYDSPSVMGNGVMPSISTAPQIESEPNGNVYSSPAIPEFNAPGPSKSSTMLPYPQCSPQLGIPTAAGIPSLPSGRFCASSNEHDPISSLNRGKENSFSSSGSKVESSGSTISQPCLLEEKQSSGRKGHMGISKRESILRQRSIHFEKSYRAFGSKASSRTGKVSGLGSLALDKKCKSGPISTGIAVKSASLKPKKMIQPDTPQASTTINLPFSNGLSASSSYGMEAAGNPSPLPIANTELSLSLPSTSTSAVSTKSNFSVGAATCSNYLGIQSDNMYGYWVPRDKKDEMLLNLAPRVQELQAQLQEWTEWAQQKVMQAASRLSKDKVELHALRQEKEEVARLKKEKQALEENTKKKLSEMEIALSKASGQVEKANAAARRLEVENAGLRQEMESAKLQASESAASCQDVSSKEMMTLKKFQSWERQKALFQEELTAEKRKLIQLQQQFKQANEFQDQLQARWKLEETMKEEALTQANSTRKEREQIEVSGKAKENAIRLKAETDMQKYKADARRLQEQISQLRLGTDSSKLTALRWGVDGSYASRLSDVRKDSAAHFIAKIMDSLELGTEDVQRERECVMCLTEEMSVVFLPCAHQVVCTKCNELHEKQGMKDCPSCRTPIQRRICVLTADS